MAGIGFVLRKLYMRDDLSGLVAACLHSTFASAGPWLCTVLAIGTISIIERSITGTSNLLEFRVILIYNFSFSLVISGPVYMVVTRYLSDSIYRRDVSGAQGLLLGSLVLLWGISTALASTFYFFYASFASVMALSAIINFALLSAVWLTAIFISAMRNYKLITHAFLSGMLFAVFSSAILSRNYGAAGILNGFSAGLSIIAAVLIGNFLAEYPYPVHKPFAFLPYFQKYWEIALSGFVYSAAIWVDKWIMWFAPEATRMDNYLVIYPAYDSSMFIAYLTTVPAMALFLFSAETTFYERYTRFYRDIERKATLAKIEKNHLLIMRAIFDSSRSFLIIQGGIAFLGILVAPQIISMIQGNFSQIGMLRYGLLGSFFQILTMFQVILLTYFDNRKACLGIQTLFLATNAIFTLFSLQAGFSYYGMGYFFASFVTFLVAAFVTYSYVRRLPYHTFITSNASVKR